MIDLINQHFFAEYYPNHLYIINQGLCYDWAFLAYHLLPSKLWSSSDHAWIEMNGLFYDSETVDGVKDYRQLPCNLECGVNNARSVELMEFKRYWRKDSKHWDLLERRLNGFLKNRNFQCKLHESSLGLSGIRAESR